ncbi:MAG: YdcF family protein [Oligoflexia bacterium]|nr:YdcF family protein [Oligoflexia bacterium]
MEKVFESTKNNILSGHDIICISSIDWDFIWQSHQEIMSTLAKNGNRILFIENTGVRSPQLKDISRIKGRIKNFFRGVKGFREQIDNLYVFSPIVLPFPYSKIALCINKILMLLLIRKWLTALNFSNPIIWSFLPTKLARQVKENIPHSLLIYYCADDFSSSSKQAKRIIKDENIFIKEADLIFVTSTYLKEKCLRNNQNVHDFPGGVNIAKFLKAHDLCKEDEYVKKELELLKINRPIIGYVGGIHKLLNFKLMEEIAKLNPQYNFVYIGPEQEDISALKKLTNVSFLGKKDHSRLPYYIKYFDIAHIPYVESSYAQNVYPSKLNEYLAMGKPVISPPIPEVLNFSKKFTNTVYLASNGTEYCNAILHLLNEQNKSHHPKLSESRIAVAKLNSWEQKIQDMSQLIMTAMERKKLSVKTLWYYSVKFPEIKKIALITICVCVLYSIIFHTSFIWKIADHLKYSTDIAHIAHSDLAIVLSSGAGEMGLSTKGYEERIFEAIKLYQKGMVDNLLLFGNSKVRYTEAQIMEIIAKQNGIDNSKITIEEISWSSKDIVKSAYSILQSKKMKSVIVISSPYHMLRLKKLFEKYPKITVYYHPVNNSTFYTPQRDGGASFEQLRAIIFEYAALLYYYVTGEINTKSSIVNS